MSLNGKIEKISNAINNSKITKYTAQPNALSQVYVCVRVHSLETRFQVECQQRAERNLSATLIIRSVVRESKNAFKCRKSQGGA